MEVIVIPGGGFSVTTIWPDVAGRPTPFETVMVYDPFALPGDKSPLCVFVTERTGESWITVKVRPATEIVPVRGAALGVTVKPTMPPLVPVAPEVIVIQLALEIALCGHPVPACTVSVPEPPERPIVVDEYSSW